MTEKTLHPFQHDIIDYIMEKPRCGLWVPMGMGKTVCVLTAVDILKTLGEITGKVLVVAPLRVANSTWPDEVEEWPHLSHLTVSTVTGSPDKRRRALLKAADIYTINYDNLVWLEETIERIFDGQWPFEMVIADESTKLKGFRTKQGATRPRVLARVAHHPVKRFIQLTGTPAPNGVKDLWACGWFIDRGERLGKSFKAFTDRWFRRDYTGFNFEPMPFAQKDIEDKLKDVCFSLNVKDHFDIDDPIKHSRMVALPKKAMAQYKQMEKRMFTELETDVKNNEVIVAVNAASKTMKCLQLANGAAYVGDESKDWREVHTTKLEELENIVAEANGMPVLVAYHFKSDLKRLLKHFKQGRALDKNPQTIKDWNAGKIPVLFAHPASAGHGLSLQHGGNILVFFSVNWNLEEHQQIIERIGCTRQKQSGYDRPVYIYYILSKGTIDEVIMKRLKGKGKIQDLLMAAMKNHRDVWSI